jgi:hypothetical protein
MPQKLSFDEKSHQQKFLTIDVNNQIGALQKTLK